MGHFIARWVINAVALAIVAHLNIGVRYDTVQALLVATLLIGLANSVVRPILNFFTMPLNCMTFGLFGYVLTFLLFYLVGLMVDGFDVTPVGAVVGSLLLGVVSGLLSHLIGGRKK